MTLLAPPPPPAVKKPISAPAQAPPRVTPEQLLAMPHAKTAELADGQLVEKNVSKEAAKTEGIAYFRLFSHALQSGTAEVFTGTLGYQCFPDAPEKVRKPDVSVIRIERIKQLADPDPGHMPIPADLVVEVISPGDLHYKIIAKVAEYHGAGFALVWVLDPAAFTLTVYPKGQKPALLSGDDEVTCEDALPGFRCKVADLFTGVWRPPLPAE